MENETKSLKKRKKKTHSLVQVTRGELSQDCLPELPLAVSPVNHISSMLIPLIETPILLSKSFTVFVCYYGEFRVTPRH